MSASPGHDITRSLVLRGDVGRDTSVLLSSEPPDAPAWYVRTARSRASSVVSERRRRRRASTARSRVTEAGRLAAGRDSGRHPRTGRRAAVASAGRPAGRRPGHLDVLRRPRGGSSPRARRFTGRRAGSQHRGTRHRHSSSRGASDGASPPWWRRCHREQPGRLPEALVVDGGPGTGEAQLVATTGAGRGPDAPGAHQRAAGHGAG